MGDRRALGLPELGSLSFHHHQTAQVIYFIIKYKCFFATTVLPYLKQASQVTLVVKNLLVNAGDIRDSGSIPGSGRFPGVGDGNIFQYSCLENPMDRGAWQATVHGVAQNRTRLT